MISCSFPSIVLNLHRPFISGITSCMMCHSGCPPLHGSMSQLYASCPSLRISIVTACDSSQATKIFTSCPPCACPNCKNRLDFLCPYDENTILIEVCYSFGTPGSSTRLPRAPGRWLGRSLPSHRPDQSPCHTHRPIGPAFRRRSAASGIVQPLQQRFAVYQIRHKRLLSLFRFLP